MSKLSVQTVEASDLLLLSLDNLQGFLQSLPVFASIECTVKQLVHDLRAENSGALPMARATWSRKLLASLQAQRMKLALSFSDAGGQDAGGDNWNAFLGSLLDAEEPAESCLRSFLPFIEMLLPHGELMWDDAHNGQSDRKKSDVTRPEHLTFTKRRVLSISRQMRALRRSSNRVRDLVARAPSPSALLMRRQHSGDSPRRPQRPR